MNKREYPEKIQANKIADLYRKIKKEDKFSKKALKKIQREFGG